MKQAVAAGAIIALAGCVPAETGSLSWYETAPQAERNAYFREICSGFGFKSGTDGMANCIAQEDHNMEQRRSEFMARAFARTSNTTTTCHTYGSTTYCNSF